MQMASVWGELQKACQAEGPVMPAAISIMVYPSRENPPAPLRSWSMRTPKTASISIWSITVLLSRALLIPAVWACARHSKCRASACQAASSCPRDPPSIASRTARK